MKITNTKNIMEWFVDWYINKFAPEEFLRKPELHTFLVRAKENESTRVNRVRDQREKDIIARMTMEHDAEVEELKAEISRLETMFEDADKRKKEVEDIRLKTIRRAKTNMRISADMVYNATRLQKTVNEITGLFEGIQEKATEHVKLIEKADEQEKGKLGHIGYDKR